MTIKQQLAQISDRLEQLDAHVAVLYDERRILIRDRDLLLAQLESPKGEVHVAGHKL